MIDVHCHLENEDYEGKREEILEKCKKEMKAVITSCAHPKDFNITRDLIEKYKKFVFGTFSIHPIYVKEIDEEKKKKYFDLLRRNREIVTAIGETGLDYYWIKEEKWRDVQKRLFRDHIRLAKELNKPLVVHARDSYEDCIEILEEEDAEAVDLHMFGGRKLLERVISNQWFISMNAIVLKSKDHKKIIRDMPLDKVMLETDAPWLDPKGGLNTPLTVKKVAEKIAKIKKIEYTTVWEECARNAMEFFKLPVSI